MGFDYEENIKTAREDRTRTHTYRAWHVCWQEYPTELQRVDKPQVDEQ